MDMRLTADEIGEISRSIATEYAGQLSIVGVTAADGEADHAELLIEVTSCGEEPCTTQINVPRTDRAEMERALRDQLQAALPQPRELSERGTK
jgi:hypothetical protein